MPTANATVIDDTKAPAKKQAWGANIISITPPAPPPSKQPQATAQKSTQYLETTHEKLAILEKLTAIKPGTWFEYKINESNRKRQIKFSWYSPTTRSYIFVGPNGIQIASLSERTLVHDLYVGNARILERSSTSFIRYFLNTIYSKIKQTKETKSDGAPL